MSEPKATCSRTDKLTGEAYKAAPAIIHLSRKAEHAMRRNDPGASTQFERDLKVVVEESERAFAAMREHRRALAG
jgi:hypothetical protein